MTGRGDDSSYVQKRTQVFLRNLPLDMLEPDIETMLGEHCGPVKRIDLIKTTNESGVKLSKGFGFVTFAIEEDAAKAINTLNGKRVMGRALSCEIALKKGAKRVHGWTDIQSQNRREAQHDKRKSGPVSSSYGQATVGSTGEKRATGETEKKKSSKLQKETTQGSMGKSAKDEQEEVTKEQSSEGKGKVEGEKDGAAVGSDGKELRRLARKEAKKEIKRKAKERAKEKAAAAAAAGEEAAAEEDGRTGTLVGNINGAMKSDNEDRMGVASSDPKAIKLQQDARTVLVFGVADGLTAKQLQKRVKKCATITALTLEENEHGYLPAGRLARVVCEVKDGTRKVIDKLDGHTIHGSTLRVRRLLEVVPHDDMRQQKQQRLIVRNLDFHATNKDLAEAFAAFGPLAEVHIPTVQVSFQRKDRRTGEETEVTRDKSRGFGFVQFLCRRDAACVVKDHGVLSVCGRDAAVDFSITKDKFNAIKQSGCGAATLAPDVTTEAVQNSSTQDDKGGEEENEMSSDAHGDDDGEEEEEEEEEGSADESDDGMEVDDDDFDAGSGDSDEDEGEDNEGNGGGEMVEGGPDAAAGGAPASDPNARGKERKRASDVGQGCTVFVRNVAFDVSEESVRELFGEYGRVRFALLVKDRATGMPKGTAFVKYVSREEANRCLAAAMGSTDSSHAQDSGGSCLFMGGRALHVTRAVDQEEAGRLTAGAQKRSGHRDKRNLYLANEGLILEGTGAAEGAAQADLEKRRKARQDKKLKLKNPIFFVSPVRLSVRNLVSHVTDSKLKALAANAARAGLKEGLATPQDCRRYLEAQGEDFASITPERIRIPPVTANSVVKCKVIRNMDKKPDVKDPQALHPSKGYGFVEFSNHGQALAALRQLNNNPAYSGSARSVGAAKGESSRLIVEFSVENHAKLKLQQSRHEKFERQKEELKTLGLGQDGRPVRSQGAEKKSRGKIQREKKRANIQDQGTRADQERELQLVGGKEHKWGGEEGSRKRQEAGLVSGRGGKRGREEGDAEVDQIMAGVGGGGGEAGQGKKKRKKKKMTSFEHMDAEERNYQQLERTYMSKAKGRDKMGGGEETSMEVGAGGGQSVRGPGKRNGKGAEQGREQSPAVQGGELSTTKGKTGRWFD